MGFKIWGSFDSCLRRIRLKHARLAKNELHWEAYAKRVKGPYNKYMFKYRLELDDGLRKLIDTYLIAFFAIQTDGLKEAEEHDGSKAVNDILLDLFPKYLVETEPEKCKKIVTQISSFLGDEFPHEMNALYEYPIQKAFLSIEDLKKDMGKDFWAVYYHDIPKKEIVSILRDCFAFDIADCEASEKMKFSDSGILKEYIEDETFSDACFGDSDVLSIEDLFCHDDAESITGIADFLGIDLDYLLPLLPEDIAQSFVEKRKEAAVNKKQTYKS
jgi:hypothetical protein